MTKENLTKTLSLMSKVPGKISLREFNHSIFHFKKHCKLIGFKFRFSDRKTVLGRCNYYHKLIEVSQNFPNAIKLATALHELGHAIEHETEHHSYWNAVRNKQFTEDQKQLVKEKLAWKHGETFAKSVGIKLGPWFYYVKKQALKTYKSEAV
jgi:Zn-dependent peptidase ImmA (M78 family)